MVPFSGGSENGQPSKTQTWISVWASLQNSPQRMARSPSIALLPLFGGQGSPTKIDKTEKREYQLILASLFWGFLCFPLTRQQPYVLLGSSSSQVYWRAQMGYATKAPSRGGDLDSLSRSNEQVLDELTSQHKRPSSSLKLGSVFWGLDYLFWGWIFRLEPFFLRNRQFSIEPTKS